jgi:hypothetical protein
MNSEPDLLRIEVVDNEIVVSLPKSQLSVTYYKPDKYPQLLAKRITEKYDPRTPMSQTGTSCNGAPSIRGGSRQRDGRALAEAVNQRGIRDCSEWFANIAMMMRGWSSTRVRQGHVGLRLLQERR